VLLHVVPRVPVAGRDSGGVLGLKGQEGDRYLVPKIVVGVVAEVREVFSLFFRHVVAVGRPGVDDCLPPRVAAHVVPVDVRRGVADLVVVLDDVLDLARGTVLASCAGAELEQVRVESGLFSGRVDV